MASGPSLVLPFAGESSGLSNVSPPPGIHEGSHPLLSHHFAMKSERLHQQHHPRLFQPYQTSHHHHHLAAHHESNVYDMSYSVPASSSVNPASESRCSSVSSNGDHLALKTEQQSSGSSLESSGNLELLDSGNVSFLFKYQFACLLINKIKTLQLSYGDDPARHSSSGGDHLDLHGPSPASSSSSIGNNNNNNTINNNNNENKMRMEASSMSGMNFTSEQIACVCEALQQSGDMEVRPFFLIGQISHFLNFDLNGEPNLNHSKKLISTRINLNHLMFFD